VSISNAWQNVETLYLAQLGIRGDNKGDKAIIRIKEGAHEARLRKRFNEWKEKDGSEKKLTKLEFVVIVDRQAGSTYRADRYTDVSNRLTGLPEDIIME
jgi:hypothetical protein